MEEVGESRGGRLGEGDILIRRGTVWHLCSHQLLHYYQYVPLDCASGSISGAKSCVAFHLRGKEKGRGNDVGPTCHHQQPNYGTFSIFIYCFITTWTRHHLQPTTLELVALLLQLQSSSPTSSLFNFNPPCQLCPSSPPTSTLVAIQIPNLAAVLFPPFSLLAVEVCLMLLLPDELPTKIIIHSIKDVAVFHLLNLRNKISYTFQRICNSN
jgi:hypothetical protein